MSVFGSVGSLDTSRSSTPDYFKENKEVFKGLKEKRAGIQEKAGTLAEPSVDEMFDSHHSAYQQMAQELRDSLPSSLSSDADIAKWEAKLDQANKFAETSKAYFKTEYKQFQDNSKNVTGSNPAGYEQNGVRDSRDLQDYQYEFARLNGEDLFKVSTDENGNFVFNATPEGGGEDIFKNFDEHNFMPKLEAVDVRYPDSWWGGHSVSGDFEDESEVADNIEGRVIDDPTEAANAQRWWIESQGLVDAGGNPKAVGDLDPEERRLAVKEYAKEAAKKWREKEDDGTSGSSGSGGRRSSEDDPFVVSDGEVTSSRDDNGRTVNEYRVPPAMQNKMAVNISQGNIKPLGFTHTEGGAVAIITEDGPVVVSPSDLSRIAAHIDGQLGEGTFDTITRAINPATSGVLDPLD